MFIRNVSLMHQIPIKKKQFKQMIIFLPVPFFHYIPYVSLCLDHHFCFHALLVHGKDHHMVHLQYPQSHAYDLDGQSFAAMAIHRIIDIT